MHLRSFFRLLSCLSLVSACFGQSSPSTGAREPVAEVGGQPIYEEDLTPLVQAQMRQLLNQEYDLKSRALDNLINQKLLETEAKKKGISQQQLVQQEVESKVPEPTEGEIKGYYIAQRDRWKRPLSEVKQQVAEALKQSEIQNLRQEYLSALREKTGVIVLLHPARTEVGFDPSRVRGNPAAPVTIVEFSDFQCPFCGRAQEILKEVLAKYEGKAKLAFRDFPLRQMHPAAQPAAEASRCAGEQGKFWEYHDLLFANQSKLDAAGLGELARNLGLTVPQFDACLAAGKYKKQIEEDVQAGMKAGVGGTPAFFINGAFLSGAQPLSAFEKLIDGELAASQTRKRPSP